MVHDVLLTALANRFGAGAFRTGAPPEALAVFPARHPEIGDAVVHGETAPWSRAMVQVAIGRFLHDRFESFDTHLPAAEQAARVTADVVRFFEKLFADELLFWIAGDGSGGGWRECADAQTAEPLVADNRVYRTFAWSGPIRTWQPVPHILAREVIRDERDYQILLWTMDPASPQMRADDRTRAARLIEEYERRKTS
jgi:hypothetical protein